MVCVCVCVGGGGGGGAFPLKGSPSPQLSHNLVCLICKNRLPIFIDRTMHDLVQAQSCMPADYIAMESAELMQSCMPIVGDQQSIAMGSTVMYTDVNHA